ncbi:MAG TPA: N,N-dimethylformamidase beta subunit family domain-containing protein [Chloroflexota bacterium]|nr:N,N-dimethylformamidase beta subunit family domain-containing protein [Chloroflexota bacterium]
MAVGGRRRTCGVVRSAAVALPALLAVQILAPAGRSASLPWARSTNLNPVQMENRLPGTKSWRLKVLSYQGEIQGYASSPSVSPNGTISVSVSTTGKTFVANVYRMGWYGGKGARLVLSLSPMLGHRRPMPKPNPRTGLIICHWPVSFTIHVGASWLSGIYMVKLTASNTHQAYVPFTVTSPASDARFIFIHGVFTDEAYNDWGGKSLYVGLGYPPSQQYNHRAVKVAFHRPFVQNMGAGWFFSWEYHMVRWLERRGYDVTYATDLDVDLHPALLLRHRAILITGHDEYWSRSIRSGMYEAVGRGVSLANFAANTGYWQVRIEPYHHQRDELVVCYKTSPDPLRFRKPWLTTTMWRNPPLNEPESELTGAMYGSYEGSHGPFNWTVTSPRNWIFRGTGLRTGSQIEGIVGHEIDTVVPGYPHPRLHVIAASRIIDSDDHVQTAKSTIYRNAHGATIFDAGTIDWSWGLDDVRQNFWLYPPIPRRPDVAAQVITANILKRMGHLP